MPNWTTNAIACHKESLGLFVNEDGNVDFNMMRPMPESLHIVSGGYQDEAVKAALGIREDKLREIHYPIKSRPDFGCPLPFDVNNFDELKALGRVYLENERLYGHRDWYGWCCDNWGTKWNACQTNVDTRGKLAIVTFETAWSAPSKEMFDKAIGNYYAESFDEDYNGIYTWNGRRGGDIFRETHMTDEWDGEEYSWTQGEYAPRIKYLKELLGI